MRTQHSTRALLLGKRGWSLRLAVAAAATSTWTCTPLFLPARRAFLNLLVYTHSHSKTDNNRPNQTTTDDSRPQHQQGTHRLKRTPTHQQPKQPRHHQKHSKHHTTTATATAQPPPHHQSTPRVQSHPFRVTHHQPRPPGGAGT